MRNDRVEPGLLTPEQAERAVQALKDRHGLALLHEQTSALRAALTFTAGGLIVVYDRQTHHHHELIVRPPVEEHGIRLYLCRGGQTVLRLEPTAVAQIMGIDPDYVDAQWKVRFFDQEHVVLVVEYVDLGRECHLTLHGQPEEIDLAELLRPPAEAVAESPIDSSSISP
jgi:hypothetical protein